MFKSMDCDNLRETSQKIIVETFAPVTGMRESHVSTDIWLRQELKEWQYLSVTVIKDV